MGLRDHMLMMVAAQALALMMCGRRTETIRFLFSYGGDERSLSFWVNKLQRVVLDEIQGQLFEWMVEDRGTIGQQRNFCKPDTNGGDEIYLMWHDHCVTRMREKFPWEIKTTALENTMYHMNDLAFFTAPGTRHGGNYGALSVENPRLCDVYNQDACIYQMADRRARVDYQKNILANPADLMLAARCADGSPAAQLFNWIKKNRLQDGFWKVHGEPYALFGHSLESVTDRYANFKTVFDSQLMWMKATEHSRATHAPAHMYYWAHTNFAAEHRASVVVQFSILRGGRAVNWPENEIGRLDYGSAKNIELLQVVRSLSNQHYASDGRVVTLVSKLSAKRGEIIFSDSVDVGVDADSPATMAAQALRNNLPVRVTIKRMPLYLRLAHD